MVKCVIFDCDGVLIESEEIGTRVLLEMASKYGVSLDIKDAMLRFSGRKFKETLCELQSIAKHPFPDDFEAQFRKRSFEVFAKEVKPTKGIIEVLDSLPVPFCVASSGPVEKIRLNLTNTGLIQYFENKIFSAYDINSFKPEPGLFLYAARQMGFEPVDCAVVEDSKAGIQAALAGGFKALGFAKEYNTKELQKEGATVFSSMYDLLSLL
jgi:HAD superfamily hydrolase (TIGR01509 family)